MVLRQRETEVGNEMPLGGRFHEGVVYRAVGRAKGRFWGKNGSAINDYSGGTGIKKGNKHMGLKTVRGAWIPLSAEELPEQGSQAEMYSEGAKM